MALFPTRVDGIAGRGPNVGSVIFLFAGKEVFPLPRTPPLFEKSEVFFSFYHLSTRIGNRTKFI